MLTCGYAELISFGYSTSEWIHTDNVMDMRDMLGYPFGYPNSYFIRISSPKGPKDFRDVHRYPNISGDIRGIWCRVQVPLAFIVKSESTYITLLMCEQ
jgi:hypothetical protein